MELVGPLAPLVQLVEDLVAVVHAGPRVLVVLGGTGHHQVAASAAMQLEVAVVVPVARAHVDNHH